MSDGGAQSDTDFKPVATISATRTAIEKSDEEEKPLKCFRQRAKECMNIVLESLKDTEHAPRNILIVGQPHAGKSSFINLVHSCMRERFVARVPVGSSHCGDTGALTRHFRSFPNFGLSAMRMEEFRERHHLPVNFCLPTIFDMPGIELDADIIKYIMCGAVPPNTELRKFMTQQAIGPHLDFEKASQRKIDRVIFVASIKDDVRESLFKDVLNFVSGNEGDMASIPYYLVLTHVDQEPNPEIDVKETLLDILLLRGESKLRVQEVVNYCDDNDEEDPNHIGAFVTNWENHVKGLSALCKVLGELDDFQPANTKAIPVNCMTPYVDLAQRKLGDLWQQLRQINFHWSYCVFGIVLIFVLYVWAKLQEIASSMKN